MITTRRPGPFAGVLAMLLVCALALAPAALAAPLGAPSGLLFRLTDPRLDELSGLAAGIASPGVLYAQNDSGDSARFFALDARSGTVLASYTVPGARNVDWEDLAVATDADGRASVWLGDIGDNDAKRSSITIYRVDEPHVNTSRTDVVATTKEPQVWRLRYPDGPRDAESLAVAPGGQAYVISKSITGVSNVYAVPVAPDAGRVQTMKLIATIRFGFTGTPGGPSPVGELTATGASLAADGRVLAVRTYTDAYLWPLSATAPAGVAAALVGKPVRVALPAQPQGEGIALDGARMIIDSEHVGSAVYSLPVPQVIAGPASSITAAPDHSTRSKLTPSSRGVSEVVSLASLGVLVAAATGVFVRGWLRRRR